MQPSQIEYLYSIYLRHPHVFTDTRKVIDGGIFFALKGGNFNGNAFAGQAIDNGAAYAVVDELAFVTSEKMILVDDVLTALQQLATHHRLRSRATVLAITGTNGKTTTKELIASVLERRYNIIYTQGNLNNHIGVPLTLLSIKESTEVAIIEMGANHVGEIAAYCEWVQPDTGLITNIGKAHLEGFGGLEGVKKAKGELYSYLDANSKPIFRYADDTNLTDMIKVVGTEILTYGFGSADVCAEVISTGPFAGIEVVEPADVAGVYNTRLVGHYNAPNILCAVAVGRHFNVPAEDIRAALEAYTPRNARSQYMTIGDNHIILDAYNANPTSMALAIDNIYAQQQNNAVLCLGAMKELGEDSRKEHQYIIEKLVQLQFNKVFLVGAEFWSETLPFPLFENSRELKVYLEEHPIHHTTFLIKGSRGSEMEILLEAFK